MAISSKIRQLVTGDPGMDTFIREVRIAVGSLEETANTSTAGLQWDNNHALAYSLNQLNTTTFRNEGSAGQSYEMRLGGTVLPRLGFPSPVGNAVEIASETTNPSYIYGAGTFPVKSNDYSVEFMFLTHFAPYTRGTWDGYAAVWKTQYLYSSVPAPGPPSTIDVVTYYTPPASAYSTLPTRELTIPTGQWNHVLFTASSTSGKRLYFNGAMVSSNTDTSVAVPNTNDWFLGSASGGTYKFYGAIARFAYSTVVRPQSYAIAVTTAMRGW
jgi:hypothetical protein